MLLFPIVLEADDSITPPQTISGNQTLVSPAQNFELGFFSPGNSSHTYLGIWYKQVPKQTVIWVANRDKPLVNSGGSLTFGNDGKLILLSHTRSVLWSSNSSRAARNPVAQLLDSGSFVLKDFEDGISEEYLWQSFDYPSDTLIPGMRLGWNFKTGLNRHLTSWKSHDDPSSGEYTYSVDPRGLPQLFLYKGNKKVFRSGPWYAQQFKGGPVLSSNPVFKPIFVFDSDEVSYSYEAKDNMISRFVLSQSGLIQHFSWNDHNSSWVSDFSVQGDNCDDYGLCGAYGTCDNKSSPICKCLEGFEPRQPQDWKMLEWSGGCAGKDSQVCRKGDTFEKFTGLKLPDAAEFHTNYGISISNCEAECLKNCSCVAYAKLDINASGKGCITWFGDLFDIREVPVYGQDLYVRVPASELGKNIKGICHPSRSGPFPMLAVSFITSKILCFFLNNQWSHDFPQNTFIHIVISLFVMLDSNAARNKMKKLILLPVAVSVTSIIVVLVLWLIIKIWRRNGGMYIYLVSEDLVYFFVP